MAKHSQTHMNNYHLCMDCGIDTNTEYYMVHDHIWRSITHGKGERYGFLCLKCLERRLGRTLTAKDFPELPANEWLKGGQYGTFREGDESR